MKEDNIIRDKSIHFAIRIINLYKHLTNKKKEFILSKQILKSGTSIGANISEAVCAISKADFVNKCAIACKESNETMYWLLLLQQAEYISNKEYDSLHRDCSEIHKILTSIIFTIKQQQNKDKS